MIARTSRRAPAPPPADVVLEIRDPQGGRNMIREGDTVHVRPSAPGRRDGFDARFLSAKVDDAGEAREINVYGGSKGRAALRTFRPDRIERRAQTKNGEARR